MTKRNRISADLSDPSLFSKGIPQRVFAEMRDTPGLIWGDLPDEGGGAGFWSATRFEDVAAVSRDPELFSSYQGHIQMYNVEEDALAARASMIDMDPPDHTRLRRLVNPGFIPREVKQYADTVRERAGALLDTMLENGGGDWIKGVAKPIPIGIICDMMGVPAKDHDLMIELTDHLVAGTSSEPLDPHAYGNTTPLRLLPFNSPAAHGLSQYAIELGRQRRENPQDDLISKLVTVEIEGEKLTDEEYANFFRLLLFAGNETTRSAMAHLALQFGEHRDQFERIKADPSLLPSTVEEVVRYSSPILYFRRTATRDTELSGTKVKKGERIVMWYSAANFDEARFEDAQRYDVGRSKLPPHAGYGGGGIHTCLGAGLARVEISVLIEEMLARDLYIEIAEPPTFVDSNFVNGIEYLNVRIRSGK
jgi:cytochrome P450